MLYRYDAIDGRVQETPERLIELDLPEGAIVVATERIGRKIRVAVLIPVENRAEEMQQEAQKMFPKKD